MFAEILALNLLEDKELELMGYNVTEVRNMAEKIHKWTKK